MRLILDVLIVIALVSGMWYDALPLAVIGAWRFSFYAEIIAAGLIFDSLYGINAGTVDGRLGLFIAALIWSLLRGIQKFAR